MKKLFVFTAALIGFVVSANAQYINTTIDGQKISCKAEEKGYNIYVAAPVAIFYNEQNGKAIIAYLKGKKLYLGETTAVLNSSNTCTYILRITRKCNLYYIGDDFNEDTLSRLLDFDVPSRGNYYSCSKFKIEWLGIFYASNYCIFVVSL